MSITLALRSLVASLLSGGLLACSTMPPKHNPARTVDHRLEVRLATSSYDCSGNDTNLDAGLAAESDSVASALAEQDLRVTGPLRNPTATELASQVAAQATGPVVWLYVGHGDLVKPGTKTLLSKAEKESLTRVADSVICLKSGPLPIADLVGLLPRSAPFVLMMVNACYSADVDIRQAPVDMALISLSTQKSKPDADGGTPLGKAMRKLRIADLDLDCDGGLSDLEWFAHLQDESKRYGYGAPMLNLRRQTHSLPRLATTKGCSHRLPVEPHTVELRLESYPHYGVERVRATGFVPKDLPMILNGKPVSASRLNATGCRVDVGQCFQALPPG